MKVLMLFSQYRQPGGEERSMETEAELLRAAGHDVRIIRSRHPLHTSGLIEQAVDEHGVDIAHVQNFFPFVQPRHYRQLAELAVPVVQTIRNYRLTCISANHWRDGRECHECSYERGRKGVTHGCYRSSRTQSLAAMGLMARFRSEQTWTKHVTSFIAVSEHVRSTVANYLGAQRVVVIPNTVLANVRHRPPTSDIIYVGRLAPEKGVSAVARLWAGEPTWPTLRIAGDGPDRQEIDHIADGVENIQPTGQLSHNEALQAISDSSASIIPWKWAEPFGRTLMESLAVGTPVIASPQVADRFPKLRSVVTADMESPTSIATALSLVDAEERRADARVDFSDSFSPETTRELLLATYEAALGDQNSGQLGAM